MTTFRDYRNTSAVPLPMTFSSRTVPKRYQESSRPAGKRSKMPERRTSARVPNSALLLLINKGEALA
jgi:hypothetical protein